MAINDTDVAIIIIAIARTTSDKVASFNATINFRAVIRVGDLIDVNFVAIKRTARNRILTGVSPYRFNNCRIVL